MSSTNTIAQMLHESMSSNPNADSYYYPDSKGDFVKVTNGEALTLTEKAGAGLHALGLKKGDRIAIMANTRYEWQVVDNGAMQMGHVVVAIYPTTKEEHTIYILEHSGSSVAILEDKSHWEMIEPYLNKLTDLQHIVMLNSDGMAPGDWISYDQLLENGAKTLADNPSLLKEGRNSVTPDDLAGLVYTSGTTGLPKGVALSHSNLHSVANTLDDIVPLGRGDKGVVYLPMSHILQRVNTYYGSKAGIVGYFAPAITELVATCQAAQPSSVSGVPRVYEKVHSRIMAGVSAASESRQKTFNNAISAGIERARLELAGKPVPLGLKVKTFFFERLVFKKLRGAIFGENARMMTSGAAPISVELLEFFHAIGLPIYEGYGLTETSSPITLNLPGNTKLGTVGPPLPGSQIKIADDGEILLKGPGVFKEYYKNEEATKEAFTDDGWFKSGDIGEIDADGYLKITDRKKFIIITAAGKNIAPAPIEQKLNQHPLIGQVVVHGDKKKYLTALLALDSEGLAAWAEANGKANLAPEAIAEDPQLQDEIKNFVAKVNGELARFETIKYHTVIPEEFSVENGLLTPSMKIKRKTVEETYSGAIDSMYSE
ncbi:MAG: long-chain fatty acid--CoA ligase [Anaerolineae bacterium]